MEKKYTHPIENVIEDTLANLKSIVDISTVVGDAIKTPDGNTIIPVSKVILGYVGGGGEYKDAKSTKINPPFATGSGAGVSVIPIGFLIENNGEIKYVPTECSDNLTKVLDVATKFCEGLVKKNEI